MLKCHFAAIESGLLLVLGAILFNGCANSPSPTTTAPPVSAMPQSASNTPTRTAQDGSTVTTPVPAGTLLRVRLYHSIDTRQVQLGDSFIASLSAPVTVENKLVVPKGTVVRGSIREASLSKRLKDRASVTLTLDRMEWNGAELPIDTNNVTWNSGDQKKRNLAWIGGYRSQDTGGAGVAGAASTGKLQVRIPAESILTFRLEQTVVI